MIIQFKNRRKELHELKDILESDKFEFTVIYGRRRIGKTELILNATKNYKRIYYLATEENNLERFYNVCLKHFPEISRLKKDYEVFFEFLKDKVKVIIIDEFQNMIKENKNIVSLFQSVVDVILKKSTIKFFLLGSSVSIITSEILSYKSPLYGRRTASLNLKKIPFFSFQEFFPSANFQQLAEIYGFTGGIPFYLIKIDKAFWAWLKDELKKKRSFLTDEIDFLLRYEFEDLGTYKLILQAIAFGKTKINEIKDFIKVKRTDISPYLKNLIEVGFIKRIVPVTENIKSRFGRYYLTDNFLKFWFRYVYPNISSIEEGIFDVEFIKKDYPAYLGQLFEEICKEFLINAGIFKFTKIGKQWGKISGKFKPERGKDSYELDIVALNENTKEIFFAECKWKSRVNAEKIIGKMTEKSRYVRWHNSKRKEIFIVFAKSFTKKINNYGNKRVYCFDLRDLEQTFDKIK